MTETESTYCAVWTGVGYLCVALGEVLYGLGAFAIALAVILGLLPSQKRRI